ncbi:MAG: hypothetical protein M1819_004611 [Sarea resinae]|nr:MAG: hypothetical protein M1819_004611 [Sarea resinae]
MLSRTLRRCLSAPQKSFIPSTSSASILPPNFLLPLGTSARRLATTSSTIEDTRPTDDLEPLKSTLNSTPQQTRPAPSSSPSPPAADLPPPTSQNPSSPTTPLSPELLSTLPALLAQSAHYATIHIHSRPYLLTQGDTVRLPFLMPSVQAGDVLRLTRASNLGSRDYTLKGTPWVDERLFECRARVMGVEAEPMRIKEKTKRRQRRVKTVYSKHRFTVLRVSELRVKAPEELKHLLPEAS